MNPKKKNRSAWTGTLALLALTPFATAAQHDYAREFESKTAAPCNAFYAGDYAESTKMFLELSNQKRNGNLPIYCCELISAALLNGDRELAFKATRRAVKLLEGFWDEKKEAAAASFWGNESDKVYKGDPYERAMLYFLYGMQLLERGDVDNAAAAFRRSLLMDGDTEKRQFQADFGLPFFLLAKCCHLQGDSEQCQKNLQCAFVGACADKNFVETLKKRIIQEFKSRRKKNGVIAPPSPEIRDICAIGGRRGVILGFDLKRNEKNREIVDWLFSEPKTLDELMNFDTVAVLWNGIGPRMLKTGTHGEKRVILSGEPSQEKLSVRLKDGNAELSFIGGLGNINFQATTRGGREMDNVLKDKATAKDALNAAGTGMTTAGTGLLASSNDASLALAGLAISVGGIIVNSISNSVNAEADTRNWRCLPHEMRISCFSSSDGATLVATSWQNGVKKREKAFPVPEVKDAEDHAPVRFVHIGAHTGTWRSALSEETNRIARELLHSRNPDSEQKIIAKAEGGNADAAFWLGVYFSEKAPERAVYYYEKAATLGKKDAALALALLLLNKKSSVFDEIRGIAAMKTAAENGIPLAQYYLGCFYANLPDATFDSIPYDKEKARDWLRKAAANDVRLAVRELRGL